MSSEETLLDPVSVAFSAEDELAASEPRVAHLRDSQPVHEADREPPAAAVPAAAAPARRW